MNLKFTILALFIAVALCNNNVSAQGCVAIRGMGCGVSNAGSQVQKNGIQFNSNFRYFESFRHFRGSHEEANRVEAGTEVINDSYFLELGLTYGLTERLALNLNLPFIHYDRSSLYEHYGNSTTSNPEQKRFSTSATGIGDLRVGVNYALIDPAKISKLGITVGAGIKLPTGNSNVTDEFHKRKSDGSDSTFTRPVDQSIQLGDGGFGFNLELQANYMISSKFSLYMNSFYLFNPENTNNTLTRGTNTGDPITLNHSIADQMAFRLGANYMLNHNINFGLGSRYEGVPSKDIIGESNGFRRPGYVISAEPSFSYSFSRSALSLSVPVALYRNRTKSVFDLADPTGQRHGDAAFADYSINLSFIHRIR